MMQAQVMWYNTHDFQAGNLLINPVEILAQALELKLTYQKIKQSKRQNNNRTNLFSHGDILTKLDRLLLKEK